jgi:DNA-binding MarR family transcriptional regulator/transposase
VSVRKLNDLIHLTDEEKKDLEAIAYRPDAPTRMAQRAGIILLAAEGMTNKAIAQRVGVSRATVILWRKRYLGSRLAGLQDIPGRGAKSRYGKEVEHRILAMLNIHPPRGHERWTGKLLAEELGNVSSHHVWRVLRKHGIQLKWFRRVYVGEGPESTRIANNNLSIDVRQVNPNYKLWQLFCYTYRLIDSISAAVFRKYGLSPSTVAILSALYQTDEHFKPTDLAVIFKRKPNTITAILNRLEKQGLLKKIRDTYKQNIKRVSLTEKGQSVFRNVMNNNVYHEMFAALSEEKRNQFMDCIYDLLENFGANRPPVESVLQTENESPLEAGVAIDGIREALSLTET